MNIILRLSTGLPRLRYLFQVVQAQTNTMVAYCTGLLHGLLRPSIVSDFSDQPIDT
jgi:hypothetical protein